MKFIAAMFGQTGMRLLPTLLLATMPLLALADDEEHVKVTLLSEQGTLIPGKAAWLGLRLEHAPHWHTYWINPGDSGLPTKLEWQLPTGFRAGAIAWPTPERIKVGDLYNFGYEGDTLLPVPIDVPADAQPGTSAHIAVEAKWLVCREECIPGKANLTLDLPIRPVAAAPRADTRAMFDAARSAQPQPAPWQGTAREHGGKIQVMLHGADLPTPTDALLVQRKVVNYAPPQISRSVNEVTLVFDQSDYFAAAPSQLDIVVRADAHAFSVNVPFSSSP